MSKRVEAYHKKMQLTLKETVKPETKITKHSTCMPFLNFVTNNPCAENTKGSHGSYPTSHFPQENIEVALQLYNYFPHVDSK